MSDFGMSKVIDSRFTTPLKMFPGILAYMPQEALGENPKYTEKLDCFSFGVLVIQILTRLFPNPSPRKKEVESALSLTGTVLVPVAETECRKEHINMISRQHPLLDAAIACLALRMEDRPSAHELCHRVEEMLTASPREVAREESFNNSSSADAELCKSVECQEIKQHLEEEIVRLQQLLEERPEVSNEPEQCSTCAELRAALEESNRNSEEEIAKLRQEMKEVLQNSVLLTEVEHCPVYTELNARKEDLEKNLEDRCEVIQHMEDDLRQQLDEASANVRDPGPCPRCAELEETRGALEERVATLMSEVSSHEENLAAVSAATPSNPAPVPAHSVVPHPQACAMSVGNIRSGTHAPALVAQSSSTVFRNCVYCQFWGGTIFGYDIRNNTWQQSPTMPGVNLIVTHKEMDKLMPVACGTLYVMHDGRWTGLGDLKPLSWGLHYYGGYFIVFGPSTLRAVKLGDGLAETHSLNTSPSFSYASTVVCNGAVYLIGVRMQKKPTNRIFRLPLGTLFRSKSSWLPKFGTVYWQEIAPLPVSKSTGFTFGDNLLAVGGYTNSRISADIYLYNEQNNEWLVIGRIPTPRYSCLAEVVGNELVVVGGWLNNYSKCDLVEIVTLFF